MFHVNAPFESCPLQCFVKPPFETTVTVIHQLVNQPVIGERVVAVALIVESVLIQYEILIRMCFQIVLDEVVEPNNANAYFGNPLYEGEYYFKILDYDETKVLVETNYNQVTISGTKYPYMITVLHKREIPNYSYVPFEEWLKVFEELENK